jgi:hypothetical protein
MSAYITSPFKPSPTLLIPGFPTYLWGSWNDKTGPTTGNVLSNSAVTTTATVTVQILSGNVPFVGAKITVVGSQNSANFNVTNATILTVSAAMVPDAGIYTLTYAISSTTQGTLLDGGQFIIPQPEVGEALAAGASVPAVMPYGNATFNQNQGLTAVVSFPSLPTSVIVSLQQAVQDLDSEYATVATVATVSGGAVTAAGSQITVDPTLGRFFRFSNGTVIGGTLPTIIAKLLM